MRKLALVIGLNALDMEAYFGFPGWLANPESDATVMAEQLVARGYTLHGHLTGTATRQNFIDSMREAAAILEAGDSFFLHYSGHGSDEGGLFDSVQSFCFFDGQLTENEFRELLALFKPGVNVVCSLDCCHSGGFERALDGTVCPRVVPHRIRQGFRPDTTRSRVEIVASVILLCACKSSETASDGDNLGEWTNGLTSAMQATKNRPSTTWRQLFGFASLAVQGQTPQLKQLGAPGLADQVAFSS